MAEPVAVISGPVNASTYGELTLVDAIAQAVGLAIRGAPALLALQGDEWVIDHVHVRGHGEAGSFVNVSLALRPVVGDAPRAEVHLELCGLLAELDEMRAVFGDRVEDSEVARLAVLRQREECAKAARDVAAEFSRRGADSFGDERGDYENLAGGAEAAAERIEARGTS